MTADIKEQLAHYQKKWAYQKYWVMAQSQQHYNALRLLFKGNDWSVEKATRFEELIREAEGLKPTLKTLRTAYQHVWGYFKKVATDEELATYKTLEGKLEQDADAMLTFLQELTAKYQPPYLIQSRLMQKGLS